MSWRPRGADGVRSSPKASRLETEDEPKFQYESEGRKRLCPSSSVGLEEFLLPRPFVLLKPSTDWIRPTHAGEDGLQSTHSKATLLQKHTHGHTQKDVWPNVWPLPTLRSSQVDALDTTSRQAPLTAVLNHP